MGLLPTGILTDVSEAQLNVGLLQWGEGVTRPLGGNTLDLATGPAGLMEEYELLAPLGPCRSGWAAGEARLPALRS